MNHPSVTRTSVPQTQDVILFRCLVSQTDIDSMLDSYESGMADLTTQNAVSRALRRALGLAAPVTIELLEDGGRQLRIGNWKTNLPSVVGEWLHASETGHAVKPFSFALLVPARLIGRTPSPASSPAGRKPVAQPAQAA